MQNPTKLKTFPSNPAYAYVFNTIYENVYDKQPNTIQPFGVRVKSHFTNSDITPIVISENPPWLNPRHIFNLELTKYKKSETNPLLIHFAEIVSITSEYSAIYTDGCNKNIDITFSVHDKTNA